MYESLNSNLCQMQQRSPIGGRVLLTDHKLLRVCRSENQRLLEQPSTEMLKHEVATLKATLRDAEHMITSQIEQVNTLMAQLQEMDTKVAVQNGELHRTIPAVSLLIKEHGELQHRLEVVEASTSDLTEMHDLDIQIYRAHEMAIHKIAIASPLTRHVNVHDEMEMYTDERYYEYGEHRDDPPGNNSTTVSDPQAGM
ncbi:uncharacterized protein MELLADRAFT_112131 [Melampsora larici-populina 98AG31]|uniref:Uncharacterized protein n=1 Tax=Melampsora larici-populina (strain 98AG31 / pathotype 3-4-7) TaxID=747676 RepID=F4S5H5_MELLP|nr:uncharacterized protein MELLADRAFT_112131 [Melampsora larici-populina 98AG31]EGG00027.1 hypothetical protein MELLADRAFT_112131 [Melampsora larici-populina 98AG31]